jgi:predicted N-acetyltransferase YhbS
MADAIRNLMPEEYDTFMRFLERCYGFSPGEFERYFPHTYRPSPELCASAYVVAHNGRIVSHVGLYPIEAVVEGQAIRIGGIGAVGTLPTERGKGHMTRLLYHVIDEMRAQGYPLSWLGGNRQRYNTFGWERAGMVYDLSFSRRSLDRAGVEPVPLEARFLEDALDTVARYHELSKVHTRRPHLPLQLRKDGLRLWTAEDGYAIASGQAWGPLSIMELFSASGRELGMIRALLSWWSGGDSISFRVPACDDARLARLMPCATGWRAGGWNMYRIVDLVGLLTAMKPLLARRAVGVRDLALSIGIREHDRTHVTTLVVRGGDVEVTAGRSATRYVEWTPVEAARLFLGGPAIAARADVPQALQALLPLPIYVPELDHV